MALARKGPIDEAHAAHRQALELDPNQAMLHSNVVYMLHFLPDQDDRTIAEEHRRWNRQFSDPLRPLIRPHDNDRDPERRLRIGYVSPDFHTHSVSYFFVPLLEAHDRTAFEIYAYASVGRPDEITDRIQKSADVWRDVRRLTDAELAEAVRADRIDILVDLSMHTADNRLLAFARRPAPVQVSWLGYPGSTGLETIDYRISDHYLEREDEKSEMADERQEEALCLPDSWCCFAPLVDYPAVSKLPAAERKYATFGSLNQIAKINDELLGGWARLLAAIPGSRLLMICPEGEARDRVHTLFARHGIGSERLELMAPRPWGEFTQLFQRIDIALDSFPCNGMTTTCHTLWMGVPVITRTGTTAVSRAGRSLLHTLGLPEWVARSEEEFVHIAAEWANNLPRLAELRRSMRARMASSPLMDAPRFAHHIETAYRTIWQRWCAGNSPRR